MAEVSGINGSIVFTSGDTSVHNWTLSYVGDALETTDFDDSTGGRSYIPGITNWSGSFDCYYATGNTAIAGSTGSLSMRVTQTAGHGYKGNVIITEMGVGTPVDGIATQTYTFQGTGALGAST